MTEPQERILLWQIDEAPGYRVLLWGNPWGYIYETVLEQAWDGSFVGDVPPIYEGRSPTMTVYRLTSPYEIRRAKMSGIRLPIMSFGCEWKDTPQEIPPRVVEFVTKNLVKIRLSLFLRDATAFKSGLSIHVTTNIAYPERTGIWVVEDRPGVEIEERSSCTPGTSCIVNHGKVGKPCS